MNKQALLEATKEVMRLIMSAFIGYLLMAGVVEAIVELWGTKLDPMQKTLIVGLIMSIVRSIDRYVHVNPNMESKGFLPR